VLLVGEEVDLVAGAVFVSLFAAIVKKTAVSYPSARPEMLSTVYEPSEVSTSVAIFLSTGG
jgi:hypothetical protein